MLKAIEDTRRIPVVLFTSQRPDDIDRGAGGGGRRAADEERTVPRLRRETMHRVCGADGEPIMPETPETILNVNDNEAARYATTRILHRAGFKVLEAAPARKRCRSRAKTCRRS